MIHSDFIDSQQFKKVWIIIIIHSMALFLEFDEQFIRKDSKKEKEKLRTSVQCSEKSLFDLARAINAQQSALAFEQWKEEKSSSKMHFNITLFESFSALITIKTSINTKLSSLKASILEKGYHCCLKSTELMKSICKKIRWIQSMAQHNPAVYIVNPHKLSLCVKFKADIMVQASSYTFLQIFKPLISLVYNFTKSFTPILLYTSNLLARSSSQFHNSPILRPLYNTPNGQLRQYAQIYQILPLVNSPLHIQDANTQRNFNLHCIIDNYYNQKKSKELSLFIEPLVFCSNGRLNDFQKGFSGLAYPTLKETTNERKFLFNSIRIKSINKRAERDFAYGGKSKILLNTISFIYTDSICFPNVTKTNNGKDSGENSTEQSNEGEEDSFSSQLQKNVAIKIPKGVQGSPQWTKLSEKIEYQKKILNNFRTTSCAYFPKYYQSIQAIAQLNDSLMMDYVHGSTLGDFIDNRKELCSFSSKLQILYHISNALRFLLQYEVAHLDLSPNNIIVVKDLLVKIIDFGQAYQPKTTQPYLPSSNSKKLIYTPGRTFPYAPPETSQRISNFTSQQDIFSLGVLSFQLLFGSLPITCSNEKMEKIYQNKMVNNHIMLAPERGQSYGQWEFMNIIYSLLIRMMDVNQLKRPHVIWTHIILKKLFCVLR